MMLTLHRKTELGLYSISNMAEDISRHDHTHDAKMHPATFFFSKNTTIFVWLHDGNPSLDRQQQTNVNREKQELPWKEEGRNKFTKDRSINRV